MWGIISMFSNVDLLYSANNIVYTKNEQQCYDLIKCSLACGVLLAC